MYTKHQFSYDILMAMCRGLQIECGVTDRKIKYLKSCYSQVCYFGHNCFSDLFSIIFHKDLRFSGHKANKIRNGFNLNF